MDFAFNKDLCCCSWLVQAVLYVWAPILPVQEHTVFSLCVRLLSSPEISQRASSSSFTLKHPAHCTNPSAYVQNKHSQLPQQFLSRHLSFFFFRSFFFMPTIITYIHEQKSFSQAAWLCHVCGVFFPRRADDLNKKWVIRPKNNITIFVITFTVSDLKCNLVS